MVVVVSCLMVPGLGSSQTMAPQQQYRSYRSTYQRMPQVPTQRRTLSTSGVSTPGYRTTSRSTSRTRATSRSSSRAAYRLDAGDVLAVIVMGVTGKYSDAPVHMPSQGDGTFPAVGNPMVVLNDGTLPMPLLDPISVRGLTVTQARDKISRAYVDQRILKKDRQVTLSLMRKRTLTVKVLHDNPALATRRVATVQVPADRPRAIAAIAAAGTYDSRARMRVIHSHGRATSPHAKLRNGDVIQLQSPALMPSFPASHLQGNVYGVPYQWNGYRWQAN
ncbi:polysaccharide biosynthesis/export family protein [Stieleria marina]